MGAMNELINAAVVDRLRALLDSSVRGHSGIPLTLLSGSTSPIRWTALEAAAAGVDGLSLRERSDLVSGALVVDLPGDYATVAAVFRGALASPEFTGWMMWPVTETVATLALGSDDPADFEDGLTLLSELTPRLTSEFAIRRFLRADLDRALAVIRPWTEHPNEHVRRLASEGTRAFLPWAVRVPALLAAPTSTTPILDALRGDDSDYVRRSVANHLNDLGRQSPDVATALAARWMHQSDTHTEWVVRHGLRVLIKKADPRALELLGFAVVTVAVGDVMLDAPVVELPGELTFTVEVKNTGTEAARLAIDYVVHYVKSNGTTAGKVFKLTTATVLAGESIALRKKHAFRPMTTRVHYPGMHALELQVNGQRYSRVEFELAGF
ncbi:3-methyladenine DNA glycosylase AlkC [Glaciihabitans tibetensis]|uniref:3-methyladenine DNA glycosylase AlkC n=1 Tax=Glaciihabitans tibetensis TaxID=1266600 RepID=A0A2T0VAS3_9MICO|nr:DNA alkylation repair protein [Glaciihabitans tibetensis]PRY67254.1 3-methyladenine DNA glycosylase AlkC [Glaciihabitans tibetensis]